MFIALMGLYRSSSLLLGIATSIVAGDQVCWYVDAAGYCILGKFPVGVIKYLTYPENRSIPKRWFASHHLWFLPMCILVRERSSRAHAKKMRGIMGMPWQSFGLSCIITTFLACYCRWLTPFQAKDGSRTVYLNINGAYEFWRDVRIDILHWYDHAHPVVYLLFLGTVGNVAVNALPSLLLYALANAGRIQ